MFANCYSFDDILIQPKLSTIKSRSEVNLDTNIAKAPRSLILKTPLISSPMDTVTEAKMAIKMALLGGLGIIHRYQSIQDQVEQVASVKRYLQYIIWNPHMININANLHDYNELKKKYNVSSFIVINEQGHFLGMITNRDVKIRDDTTLLVKDMIPITTWQHIIVDAHILDKLKQPNCPEFNNILNLSKRMMITHRIEKVPITVNIGVDTYQPVALLTWKNIIHYENNRSVACMDQEGRLCVGAAIGIIGDYLERLNLLVASGVDIICIDVANGFNTCVIEVCHQIRAQYPHLVIMAGNVCDATGFMALAQCDIDCIRVGIGNGSICTTRLETGMGKNQFSAIWECFKISRETGCRIISDGGSLGKTGNKVKALTAGASAIILGRTLAATEESPGQIIIRNGRKFKYYRGMASTMANISKQEKQGQEINTNFTAEGVDGEVELSGSITDLISQINGGLKSGFSYLGARNLEEIHTMRDNDDIIFNVITTIGMAETGIRVKTY